MIRRFSLFTKTLPFRIQPLRCFSNSNENVYAFEASKNDITLSTKRHTAAHILAMAVQNIIPDAQATIGPCIENGYDNIHITL